MSLKITLNNIADAAIATLSGLKVTTIVYPGDDTATDTAGGGVITLNGSGFQSGCSVLVASTAATVVTFVNSTQISFVAPALAAGTYVIYVINPDGGTAISIPGISYSGTPAWSTAAGSLGVAYETGAVTATLTAAGDAPVTYSLASGTLPPGSNLASNGTLSGTAAATASATTYTFTIRATDAQQQDTDRVFSLTISPDVVTWNTPADGTSYSLAQNIAMANVALSAASAAGGSVTYTANALPTGLTINGSTIAGTPTVGANTTTVLTATSTATRTATRTINWVVSVANDAFFNSTTLLLPGTATTFVRDASTNNFPVTIAGDTRPNNFNPYTPGYYSNYFDGSGDYLTVLSNEALEFGVGDLTAEAYVYRTVGSTVDTILQYGRNTVSNYDGISWGLFINSTNFAAFEMSNGVSATHLTLVSNVAWPLNSWVHIALVRSGNNFTLYQDGVSVATGTTAQSFYIPSSSLFWVARNHSSGTGDFAGYLSNVRVVKGTAVYTSNFTPSTTPLTAVAGTSLLTCQSNRFIDNSTNNFAVTRNGDTRIEGFDPFVPATEFAGRGSTYFDGTGDYLSVGNNTAFNCGTGDFTFECWFYDDGTSTDYPSIFSSTDWSTGTGGISLRYSNTGLANKFSVAFYNGNATPTGGSGINELLRTANTYPTKTWHHVAFVRSTGNVFSLYVNGVRDGNTTAGSVTIDWNLNGNGPKIGGGNWDGASSNIKGYVSNLRLVKGTALYTGTTYTVPSAPLTAVAGTSLLTLQNNQPANNNVFLDSSTNNLLVTRNGNATQGSFSPYSPSGWSNYFDGTGDFLTLSSAPVAATGTFTIECWVYVTGTASAQSIYGQYLGGGSAAPGRWNMLWNDAANKFSFSIATSSYASTSTYSINTWYHIAWVRDGSNNLSLYVNGVRDSTTSSVSASLYTGNPIIGARVDGTTPFTGYISNFRVTNTVVYSGTTYTVPTQPLTAIPGTSLLTCADNRFMDESPNNFVITRNGDTRVTNFSPFQAVVQTPVSYSTYLDGTGDYLSVGTNTALNLSGGDFTVEAWIYLTALPALNVDNIRVACILVYGSTTANQGYSFNADLTNNVFYIQSIGSANWAKASYTFALGTWYHVAATRSGSTDRLFVNGQLLTLTTNAFPNISSTTGTLKIGSERLFGSYNHDFSGYISNVRIVKGTAVYTANFTPSTTPLTAISGASLLTCQSSTFVDNSPNRFTITVNGDARPTTVNPFGSTFVNSTGYTAAEYGGSMYFDGTGDNLSISDNPNLEVESSDFTIEAWIYINASVSSSAIISKGANSPYMIFQGGSGELAFYASKGAGWAIADLRISSAPALATWHHIAVTRSGTTFRTFFNGALANSATLSGALSNDASPVVIGSYAASFNGYISNLRIVKGTALYTSNFAPPLTPVQPVTNTVLLLNGASAAITDATTRNVVETVGDVRISTVQSKFGGSSMAFDGSGDYLNIPASPDINLGSGNFTIEMWTYNTGSTGGGTLFCKTNSFELKLDSSRWVWQINASNNVFVTNGTLTANTWVHIALVRNGATTTLYLNGTSYASGSSADAATNTNPLQIGSGTGGAFTGYINDFRITRGVARYTTTFTPPTGPFLTY